MKPYCFAKNGIIDSSAAHIHPMDISLIRGYGIFDFFRTSNYVPLFLSDYLDRFIRSAAKTHLNLQFSKPELAEIIKELIQKNNLENGGIRMLLTGGVSENHFSPSDGQLFIFCEDLLFPSQEKYEKGVKLLSVEHVRAIADIKTTNYAYPVWLSTDWKAKSAEDVIYHFNEMISESSRSNIFIIKEGKISTPNQHILHGITRMRVLELAPETEIRPISFEELLSADEIFITSTTKKILPITLVDDHKIGTGQVGSITKKLMADFVEMEKMHTS
ncbi:branched-chain amino acid aminotransferase/4-amino-4-deoxychorismate lyase [Belliella baltica DSM 15883]|uniref:branched-chain-amino-acid transaminase n=1 Tax=Belliella baltica (strain DSM 15883 / CIP 108006 / LMG 21964 / BA134) TaxID=866536 RepID=I3Z0B3_BELBD|nr:aminotransferase class IV [Belliella baltica]AFL82681.1 branched-chain amino acid aminotransferase/4-amino-4-deoxychorismate lyase [Belliella baltica DSM 15883]